MDPGILPIRITPSIHRSLRRFAPSRFSTVARISLFSLRGVRTLVIASVGPALGLVVGLFNSASVIPHSLSHIFIIFIFIYVLKSSLYYVFFVFKFIALSAIELPQYFFLPRKKSWF